MYELGAALLPPSLVPGALCNTVLPKKLLHLGNVVMREGSRIAQKQNLVKVQSTLRLICTNKSSTGAS